MSHELTDHVPGGTGFAVSAQCWDCPGLQLERQRSRGMLFPRGSPGAHEAHRACPSGCASLVDCPRSRTLQTSINRQRIVVLGYSTTRLGASSISLAFVFVPIYGESTGFSIGFIRLLATHNSAPSYDNSIKVHATRYCCVTRRSA